MVADTAASGTTFRYLTDFVCVPECAAPGAPGVKIGLTGARA